MKGWEKRRGRVVPTKTDKVRTGWTRTKTEQADGVFQRAALALALLVVIWTWIAILDTVYSVERDINRADGIRACRMYWIGV